MNLFRYFGMRNTRFVTPRLVKPKQFSRFLFLLSLLTLVGYVPSGAQGTIRGRGTFQLDMDVARFYGDSTQTYVEFYYDILENILAYKPDSGRFMGAVNMKLDIRKDSVSVAKKEWTVPHSIADTSKLIPGQKLVGIETFGLPSGSYTFSMTAYDVADPARRDSMSGALPLPEFSREKESFSDVEFCTSIQQSTNKQSMYFKNTLEVIPNASRLYGIGLPIIYYYTELYNLLAFGMTS